MTKAKPTVKSKKPASKVVVKDTTDKRRLHLFIYLNLVLIILCVVALIYSFFIKNTGMTISSVVLLLLAILQAIRLQMAYRK